MENYLIRRVSPRTSSLVSLAALLLFLPFLLFGAYQTVILVSRATGTPATIIVDAKAPLGLIPTDFYHAFSQGGEEATDMLAPVVDQVRSLRPRIIRIDHIYDHHNVVGRSGDQLTFDFSSLDRSVDTILAVGAKPMLVLSFMPAAIAQGGSVINPPNNWDEWSLVVQRTIEHFSGRGEKNISGVYYEVWNEPDLAQFGSWKVGGEKSYLQLYRYASIGAGRAQNVNTFYLGGPATTGLYNNWIIALITSGNRVDFLSWHSYLQDPRRFDQDQRNLISWLLPYPRFTLIPTLITEAGFTGNKDRRYGTSFAAAYTATVVRQLISGGPDFLFSFQLKDGPGQEEGNGWGLVTHEGNGKRPKPRYWVYTYLDAMAGTRLSLAGEGTWVTGYASVDEKKTIRILLVNFDPYGSHTETVPVTLTNLESGTYTIRQRYFLGQNTTSQETVTTTELKKEILMPAQSIVILEVTRTP